MTRGKRKRGWRFWSLASLLAAPFVLFALAAGFSGCMSFEMKPGEVKQVFERTSVSDPRSYFHKTDEGALRVVISGNESRPCVVFVHGSPGSWDAFIGYLSDPALADQYCLVSVDRPGFGATTPDEAEPSLEVQARRIHEAVAASGARLPAVWVGHSLGGPVVARIAVDYPKSARGLVLVAPSIDPALEKLRWYNWIAAYPPVSWALSRAWTHSNQEILPLRGELELLAERLAQIEAPTIVVQGDKDDLVDPANADFVAERFVNAPVDARMLEGADHFTVWNRRDAIVAAFRDLWRKR